MSSEDSKKEMYQVYAGVCKTLAHPTRLMILDLLRGGEKSVDELANAIGIGKSNLSQHLALMREKRVLKTRRDGLNIYYHIANPKVIEACDKMRQLMLDQFSETQELLSEATPEDYD